MAERRRLFGILALGALLAALGVLAAGCGGGSGSANAAATTAATSTTTTTTGGARGPAGLQTFETCLRQHGITVPQFNGRPRTRTGTTRTTTTPRRGGGGGFFGQHNLTPTQQKAMQTCRAKLPQGGFGFRGGRGGQNGGSGPNANNPGFAKYTQCLAKHGVKFGQTSSRSAFAKAQAACRSLLPKAPTPTTTTTAVS